jgi:hypothetical protein
VPGSGIDTSTDGTTPVKLLGIPSDDGMLHCGSKLSLPQLKLERDTDFPVKFKIDSFTTTGCRTAYLRRCHWMYQFDRSPRRL